MPEPCRFNLPRSARITSGQVFDRIFAERIRAGGPWFTLYAGRNEGLPARLGVAVPRRFGNAVRRNRIKRLVREAFRQIRHELPSGLDWVVVPRPGTAPRLEQLIASLAEVAEKLARRFQ